jgi:hypothetical protein
VEKQTAGGAALHLQKQNGGQRSRFFAMRQCSTFQFTRIVFGKLPDICVSACFGNTRLVYPVNLLGCFVDKKLVSRP